MTVNTLLRMALLSFKLMKQALVIFLCSSLNVKTRMDRHTFDYSLKNIPIPSEKQFELEFLNSIHKLDWRMRWRATKYLHPEFFQNQKETYSLKSSKAPPYIPELKFFHDGLCDLAKES